MGFYYLQPQSARKPHRLKGELIVGRTQGGLRFEKDKRMSGKHCRFVVAAGNVCLEDLQSSNGTFINGERMESGATVVLKTGDRVSVGEQNFLLGFNEKEPRAVPFEMVFLGAAVLCMAFAVWPRNQAGPRVPAAAPAEEQTDPLTVSLRFAEDDFKNLAINYSRLLDAVIIDRSPKSGAVADLETRFEAQFARAIQEAEKLTATDDDGKEIVRLYTLKVSLLRDHMHAMRDHWKTNDVVPFKKSVELLKRYKETAAAQQELSDRRANSRSAPAATVRERPAFGKPGRL